MTDKTTQPREQAAIDLDKMADRVADALEGCKGEDRAAFAFIRAELERRQAAPVAAPEAPILEDSDPFAEVMLAMQIAAEKLEWIASGTAPDKNHDLDGGRVTATIKHAKQMAAYALSRLQPARATLHRLFQADRRAQRAAIASTGAAPLVPEVAESEQQLTDALIAAQGEIAWFFKETKGRSSSSHDATCGKIGAALAAVEAKATTASASGECTHPRQATTALGGLTGTGWKCRDCGELLSDRDAPDRATAPSRTAAPLLGFEREDLEAIADGLESGYAKGVDVGSSPLDGVESNMIESTTAAAARFIRAALTQQSAAQSLPPPELTWLYTHCRAIGMDCKSDSGKWEHDIALFTTNLLNSAQASHAGAETEKQAARYRWLRDKSEPGICAFYLSVGQAFKDVKFTKETVDNAIDAQIAPMSAATPGPT